MLNMDGRSRKLVGGLIAAQAAAATLDGVAFYPVAGSSQWAQGPKQRLNTELDRLQCPQEVRKVIPVVKLSSAIGLLLGLRRPAFGRLTAAAVVAYFITALGFHARAKDPISKFAPAAVMLAWSLLALRDIGSEPRG